MTAHDRAAAPDTTTTLDKTALRILSVPAMTLLTAVAAQIAIPTDPLGIPVTLQTLAVLLCALALGPKLGAASMLLYLATGALGVGVFADGQAGLATILGQTGGYLIGFVVAQPVVHAIIRRRDGTTRGWGAVLTAGLALHAVIFAIGVPWLWTTRYLDPGASALSAWDALYHGCLVFVPGALLKSGIAAWIGARLLPHVARRIW